MKYLPEEVWKSSPIYPGIEASSHGRIRRRPHIGVMPHGGTRSYKSKPTFGTITRSTMKARHVYFAWRYYGIGNIKVHRAVCSAFHGEPPFEGAVVIHRNESGLDNRPTNLRWGTQRENLNAPRFLEYNRRANKMGVRKASNEGVNTSEVYFGLPHLIEEIKKREVERQRVSA